MANMTAKLGGQGRQADKSKAEANPSKSTSRSSENAAFALAAGSIGLAVTLLNQDRAEAAAKATYESSGDHTDADGIAATGDLSSSIDNIAMSSGHGHEGPHPSDSNVISPAAQSGGEVAVGLELPGEPVADYTVRQDNIGAPATVHDDIAMLSSDFSQEASSDHTSEQLTSLQVNPNEGINHDLQSHVDGLQFPAVSAPSDNGISQEVDSAADGVLGTVGEVVDGVGGLVENLLDGDGKGVIAGVGSTVGSVLDTVGNVISGVGGIVDNVLNTVGDVVPDLLGVVKEGVVHTVGNVVNTVADVTSSIGGIVNGLLGGDSKDTLSNAGSTIIEAVDTVGGAVSGVGGTVSNLLGGDGKGSLADVGSTIDNALDSVGGALTGAGEVVGGLLGGSASAPTNMLDAATGLLNFSDELFGVLTPTLSFLGQSIFVPNDPVDLSNHHGTTMHGLTWEG